jgi:hypothetical protein
MLLIKITTYMKVSESQLGLQEVLGPEETQQEL